MAGSLEQLHRRIIRGDRGVGFALGRAALRCAEPFYASVTALRNVAFDVGLLPTHPAPRPVISIGNITTGGTGKTPVVEWAARRLTVGGHRVAILLRGYHGGDEHRMLQASLGDDVHVEANSSRVAGAAAAVAADPDISCFLLDDGFQHRRIGRDLDMVLIDATDPFGFGHVLPRGLLREPMRGLRRADAFVITHCEAVDDAKLKMVAQALSRYHAAAPIFYAEHHTIVPTADELIFGFCGIGNPTAFQRQLGENLRGFRAFPDHHLYTPTDLADVESAARAVGATRLVTTQKDWIKIRQLLHDSTAVPIEPASLELRFRDDDERRLLELMFSRLTARSVELINEQLPL